jgi:hypothetical protein
MRWGRRPTLEMVRIVERMRSLLGGGLADLAAVRRRFKR